MAVTQIELARRLKAARENCGLTQQQVAEALGIARTAVVQMEAGRRAVNSLELGKMARLYGRGVGEFVSDGAFEEDPVIALFRATPGVIEDPVLGNELRHCANLCREATHLEQLLGLAASRALPIMYAVEVLSSRWDAICQGRYLAEQERNRLGLGTSPIWEIAEIIRLRGVRVTEYDMSEDISGLFFHSRDVGLVIVVNRRHHRNRRLFSYAHEYCHLLIDRGRPGTVSRLENRNELIEVRANVFAAHFLMPEVGVRAFLQTLGKGEATRQVQEIYDGVEQGGGHPLAVQKRMLPGSQDVQVYDVVALAHHFGVSYEVALYHLLNLKLIAKDRLDILKEKSEVAKSIARALQIANWDEDAHWTLTEHILALGFEAYRRGEISRNKLFELAEDTGVAKKDIEQALVQDGSNEELVEAVLPE
jgi:Zn-dependent peptidase ImmA (M78 family)/DNA-binding XRE family transcriptional regulator